MNASAEPEPEPGPEGRRRYDSPVRRQQATETRERIVRAGAEILRSYPVWNWDALTVRGVARRAEVNERTVYRHFVNERGLRDAVMALLEREAGVDLETMSLDDLPAYTTQVFELVSAFPLQPRVPHDPTLIATNQRQHDALLAAVTAATDGWSDEDRRRTAAMLDVLWSMGTYERLVADWGLDPADATAAATWVIGLVQDAIARGRRPGA